SSGIHAGPACRAGKTREGVVPSTRARGALCRRPWTPGPEPYSPELPPEARRVEARGARAASIRARAPSPPDSARCARSQVERQDQRVLAAAARRIVAAPDADLLEAVAGIQAPPDFVCGPDFEEQIGRASCRERV